MEDGIKINLQMVNQNWNEWKFQIHWNKREWVNSIICIEQKNPFCVSSKKRCLKDNNKNEHWVSQYKLTPLNTIDYFKIINSLMTYNLV